MKAPRRLAEDQEFVARLIAADERVGPPPEAPPDLLKTLDALAPAAPLQRSWNVTKWLTLVGACTVIAALASRNSLLPANTEPKSTPKLLIASPLPELAGTETAPPSANAPAFGVQSVNVGDLPDSQSGVVPARMAARAQYRKKDEPAHDPTSAPTPVAATTPSPRREVELVIAARQALTRGDAQGCLSSIALYETEFPAGQFVLEEQMMRIEATALAGDREGARKLARDHLSRVPASPYAARIQSLLSAWGAQ